MIEDIQALDSFIRQVQSTSSRKEKENILCTATEFQKFVLEFLFNPYKITGISKKKLAGRVPHKTGSEVSLTALIRYFETHQTGSHVDIDYALEVVGESDFPELVLSIVRKDLTLGVSTTTLNKVFGKGFIPEFGVQLACRYLDDPDKYIPEGTEFMVTEKLDGVRCVCMFDDSHNPHFYARSGREIEGLVEISREARSLLDPHFVYDGELLIDSTGASNSLYRQTMSIVGSDHIKKGIVFHVFDCLPRDKFKEGRNEVPAYIRKAQISAELEGGIFIREVPVLYKGTDKDKILELLDWAISEGKEGVMINLSCSPYVCGRSPGLLKVKRFNECEAVVRSVEKGTGKNENRLGAVIVEIKDKDGRGHTVRVGSGFTDIQRNDYFENPHKILNRVVEIGYFEVTKNQADDSLSLRFPTWLDRIRLDKMEEDMTSI